MIARQRDGFCDVLTGLHKPPAPDNLIVNAGQNDNECSRQRIVFDIWTWTCNFLETGLDAISRCSGRACT
jgi:hypothetical protein